MRIVLMGQAVFGARTLEALLEKGEKVAAVYAPTEKAGGKPDPLKEAALGKNVPVFQPASYRSMEVFEEYRTLKPDLTILAFVTDIIPARFFEAATRGAICYHPSLLPRHRGASAINWAIIMGDTRTGLTIFWPDGGIDTGPILMQKEIDIGPQDTTGAVYFNHLFPMGIEAIVESVALIKENRAPRIPQDDSAATYEPPCDDRVAAVNWRKSPREVYDHIRGCDPQPGAFAQWKGDKLRLYGPKLHIEAVEQAPGTIIRLDETGLHVALIGARIIVTNVRPSKGGKQPALEWAKAVGIQIGDRFEEAY